MAKKITERPAKHAKSSQSWLNKAELDALVEEATVVCYNESEQATGLYTVLEDNLKLPFETEVQGVAVTVTKIDITEDDRIIAVCKCGGKNSENNYPGPAPAQSPSRRL